MPEFLLLLIVVLAVWALVGHAIWLLGAAIVRAITGAGRDVAPDRATKERDVTRQQLDRLLATGRLDESTHKKVLDALHGDAVVPPATREATTKHPPRAAEAPPIPRPVDQPTASPTAPPPAAAVHALPHPAAADDRDTAAAGPAPPVRARLAELLAAFMEAKNIRWGELVGGLLIVFCSAALVVSLWSQIAQLPIAQVFLFTTIAAAIFGGGLYVEHKWRLPMTSRGMLIIATLLVPLNFLLLSAYGQALAWFDLRVVGLEAASLLLFAFLLHRAAAVFASAWAVPLTVAIVGLATVQLVLRRVTSDAMTLPALLALGALPWVVYAGVMAWALARVWRGQRLSAGRWRALLVLLAISSYAVAITVGLFVHLAGEPRVRMMQLSALVSLYGLPALVTGLYFWRATFHARLTWLRVAGTTVGVLGVGIMGAGIALAWPQPAYLLPPIVLTSGVLFVLAARHRLPPATAVAGCLALLGYHVVALAVFDPQLGWTGDSARSMLTAMLSGLGGRLLVPAVVVLLAVAGGVRQRTWPDHARWLLLPASVAMLASVALVGWHGLGRAGDPQWASGIYALYGVLVLAVGWLAQRRAAWLGVLLLSAATLQFAVYAQQWDWTTGLLVLATLAGGGGAVAWLSRGRVWAFLEGPCTATMWVGSTAATLLLLVSLSPDDLMAATYRFTWVGVLWLMLAGLGANRLLLILGQMVLSAAVVCYVGATADPWRLDVATLQQQAIGLAVFATAWAGLRWVVSMVSADRPVGDAPAGGRYTAFRLAPLPATDTAMLGRRIIAMVRPSRGHVIGFDHVLTAGLVIFLVGLSWFAITVFVGHEWVRPPRRLADAFVQPQAALTGRAWVLLGLLLVTCVFMFAGSARRVRTLVPPALLLSVSAAVPLLAAGWIEQFAAASAVRWWSAGFVLLTASLLWLRDRPSMRLMGMHRVWRDERQVAILRGLALTIGGAPILLLSVVPAARGLLGLEVVGPAAESLFGRMAAMPAYAVPLACLSLALIGHAMRETRGGFAYAGALVGNLTVSLGYLLHLVSSGQVIGDVQLMRLVQLNATWSGAFALAWVVATTTLARHGSADVERHDDERPSDPLKAQSATAVGLTLLFLVPALGLLLSVPTADHALLGAAGHGWGWLGAAVTFVAAGVVSVCGGWRISVHVIAAGVTTGVLLLALTVARVSPSAAYSTLTIASLAAAWVGLVGVAAMSLRVHAQAVLRQAAEPALRWVVLLAGGCVALALRGIWSDLAWTGPAVWWAAGPIAGVAGLMVTVATLRRFSTPAMRHAVGTVRPWLWAGLLLLNLAAALLWLRHWAPADASRQVWWTGLLGVQVMALLPTAIMSFVLERSTADQGADEPASRGEAALRAVHLAAAALGLVSVVVLVLLRVVGPAVEPSAWVALHVGALLVAMGLTSLCLWDTRGVYAPHALWALLVAAAVLAIDVARPGTAWVAWLAVVGLGTLGLLSGAVWASRQHWGPRLRQAGVVVEPIAPDRWLLAAMMVMAVAQMALAFRIVMGDIAAPAEAERGGALAWRLSAAVGPFLHAGGLAYLARGWAAGPIHHAALAVGAAGAVLWGWAWTDPAGPYSHWAQYAAVAMLALAAATGFYGFVLYRLLAAGSPWSQAVRDAVRALLLAAGVTLGLTLVLEITQYIYRGEVLLPMVSIIGVIAALAGGAAMGLFWAVAAQHDPLRLSDRKRVGYVYAAEAFVALIFVHIRLTLPWLFTGVFEPYWPLLVMGLAFLGVGMGAWFDRQRVTVLAEPLSRTAMFLPLLPVLGFWMTDAHVHYSGLLLIIGVFYGIMAFNRRSFRLGVVAAIAANGALWYVLHRTGDYGLLDHPQLWLIPIGLSVLVAAHLNRAQLTARQMGTIRYTCLSLVYLSSTAEMFLQGVVDNPWLPLVLAGLSVAGVMLGMLLRVQSFLFTGCGFLVLALLTILYHASANLGWVWIWYVAGIGVGVLILFLFATFEHRRQRVLEGLDSLRHWRM